ncbi:hypothetical protein AKJ56_01420 [candidate division MSBL1 archaeon SCGC-AAA382N08]|uniref:Uncharacterized protein n=1 Tax=candidate division MSBL1 archaeon SCGC-AAA382N08 TaxID=1698285 RepID=A0A133VPR1_9EURY|nr:hypothetical protein AKJ56_01420 [candidate division MSBL1 archaeon SCGC-AAA382N08]
MAWEKTKDLELDYMYHNLKIENAQKSGDYHELGRLLRTYRRFLESENERDKESDATAYERAIRRYLTRRKPGKEREPRKK